jgi:hypothetical protein
MQFNIIYIMRSYVGGCLPNCQDAPSPLITAGTGKTRIFKSNQNDHSSMKQVLHHLNTHTFKVQTAT